MNWQKNDKCLENYRVHGIQNEHCLLHSHQHSRFHTIDCAPIAFKMRYDYIHLFIY